MKKKLLFLLTTIILLGSSFLLFRTKSNPDLGINGPDEIQTAQDTLGITTDEETPETIPPNQPTISPTPSPSVQASQVLGEDIVYISETRLRELINSGAAASSIGTEGQNLSFSDGLSLDGETVKNTDKGSSQSIFKTINIMGDDSLSASINNDALSLIAGSGIVLNSDPFTKTISISQSVVQSPQTSSNSAALNNYTWESPGVIGNINPNHAAFLNLSSRGTFSLPNLSSGVMHVNNTGVVSSSLLNLKTEVTNILSPQNGGTGLSSYSAGDITYFNSGTALSRLSIGARNSVLTSNGTSPVWSSSLALPGTLNVTGETKLMGNVGIGTTPQSGFHVSLNGNRAIFQMFSVGSLSPLNLWNSSTSASAGSGMLFGAGTNPQGGFIGGMLSQRIDAASNSRTALRVLSNGSLSDGEAGAPFYLEGSSTGIKLVTTAKFGMGTNTPQEKLHLNNGNIRVDNGSLCVSANTAGCKGLTAGKIYASNTTVQAADLAENYISSENLEPGDLVMPEGSSNSHAVKKTTDKNESSVLGVISTKPGVTLGSDASPDAKHPFVVPIALNGRVPVKVSAENGPINVGDSLTSSSVPGVAMKADGNTSVIGKSLESYTPIDSKEVKLIMVYINLSWKYADVELRSAIPDPNVISGQTNLILGDLELKGNQSDTDKFSSLNTKNYPLYIQSDSQKGLDLFKGVLTIDPNGDINTSGSISTTKLFIKESDSDSSIGTIEVPEGQQEVIVKTTSVSEKSKILATPDIPVLFGISKKIPGESFTILLEKPAVKSLKLDWWIIN